MLLCLCLFCHCSFVTYRFIVSAQCQRSFDSNTAQLHLPVSRGEGGGGGEGDGRGEQYPVPAGVQHGQVHLH